MKPKRTGGFMVTHRRWRSSATNVQAPSVMAFFEARADASSTHSCAPLCTHLTAVFASASLSITNSTSRAEYLSDKPKPLVAASPQLSASYRDLASVTITPRVFCRLIPGLCKSMCSPSICSGVDRPVLQRLRNCVRLASASWISSSPCKLVTCDPEEHNRLSSLRHCDLLNPRLSRVLRSTLLHTPLNSA